VDGRNNRERENKRFAERVNLLGGHATVVRANDKTHLSFELEIGIRGDAVTEKVLNFIETSSAKRPGKP